MNWRIELADEHIRVVHELRSMTENEIRERVRTISNDRLLHELGLLKFSDGYWGIYMQEADRRYLLGDG